MIAAALVLLAFVVLCIGCAIFEALTRPALDQLADLDRAVDLDANLKARWQG